MISPKHFLEELVPVNRGTLMKVKAQFTSDSDPGQHCDINSTSESTPILKVEYTG